MIGPKPWKFGNLVANSPNIRKMIAILIIFNASRMNRNVKQLIVRDLVLSRGFNTPDELFVI